MRLKAVDELSACDGPEIDGSAQYEVGQLVDPTAAVEAIGPLRGVPGQVLGADPMKGAVQPRLDVGEQHVDHRQDRLGVPCLALDHRIVAEVLAEIDVAIEAVGNPPRARCDRRQSARL